MTQTVAWALLYQGMMKLLLALAPFQTLCFFPLAFCRSPRHFVKLGHVCFFKGAILQSEVLLTMQRLLFNYSPLCSSEHCSTNVSCINIFAHRKDNDFGLFPSVADILQRNNLQSVISWTLDFGRCLNLSCVVC